MNIPNFASRHHAMRASRCALVSPAEQMVAASASMATVRVKRMDFFIKSFAGVQIYLTETSRFNFRCQFTAFSFLFNVGRNGCAGTQFPQVSKKKMVESFDVVFQNRLGRHVRVDVAIINAVERIQLDGESFEVSGQKSGIDGIIPHVFAFSLHVIQKNRDMRHVLFREPMKQKFVHEDFSEQSLLLVLTEPMIFTSSPS